MTFRSEFLAKNQGKKYSKFFIFCFCLHFYRGYQTIFRKIAKSATKSKQTFGDKTIWGLVTPQKYKQTWILFVKFCRIYFHEFILQKIREKPSDRIWIKDVSNGRYELFGNIPGAVSKIASGLSNLGFTKGDVLCMFCSNFVEYWLIALAAWTCGGCVMPVNCELEPKHLEKQLNETKAKIIICDELNISDALGKSFWILYFSTSFISLQRMYLLIISWTQIAYVSLQKLVSRNFCQNFFRQIIEMQPISWNDWDSQCSQIFQNMKIRVFRCQKKYHSYFNLLWQLHLHSK